MFHRGRKLFFAVALILGMGESPKSVASSVNEAGSSGWGVQQEQGTPIRAALKQGDLIVFTANQGWLSRIYVLNSQGAVLRYFEYEYYIFSDLEIADNELYATDWVAPRLYQIDIDTGALDVIVDDWSLISMYDVAWDGQYFYIKEWSLNRYSFQGSWDSSTSFSESLRGSAWDSTYYWTLNSDGHIQCWDISAWPTITELPEHAFDPPSSACRGLWFDGEYFWTAESIDGTLGYIYQFGYDGQVVNQLLAPAFRGYAAGVIKQSIPGDITGDGIVNIDDIFAVLGLWGDCPDPCPPYCEGDVNEDCTVNIDDIFFILGHWG